MKKHYSRIAMLVVALVCNLSVFAFDFSKDGIFYNVVSADKATVEVTFEEQYKESYTAESVVIPSSVENDGKTYTVISISANAFTGSTALTYVTIPSSITSIGDNAFAECPKLASIIVPESVTSIGDAAFSSCTSLTKAVIWGAVSSVGGQMFYQCAALQTVSLPTTVKSISAEAFVGCTSLKKIVVLSSSVPTVDGECFDVANYKSASLYVSKDIAADYGDVEPWSKFENIIDVDPAQMSEDALSIDNILGKWYEQTSLESCNNNDNQWYDYSCVNHIVEVKLVGDDKVEFTNMLDVMNWGGCESMVGTVDMYAKTITFEPQTVMYDGDDWLMSGGYDDATVPVVGTINSDGSITINGIYMNFDYYGDGQYYSYTYGSKSTLTRDTVAVEPDEPETPEVDVTPIDLAGKIVKLGEKADNFVVCADAADVANWYLLEQKRGPWNNSTGTNDADILTPLYDKGLGNTIYRASSADVVTEGAKASDVAQYLVRFLQGSNEESYKIQFGTGRYFGTTVVSSATPGEYNVYQINETPGHFGINLFNYGSILDNNGAGGSVSFWSTGQVAEINGNNDWTLVTVTLVDDPNAVNVVAKVATETVIYNLSGQRVNKTGKGVYIENGVKVVR